MKDKLSTIIITGYCGGILLLLSSLEGWFGCRGEEKIYPFKYKNQEAAIMKKDMRFAKDQYYIAMGNDKLTGRLITDNGKGINVQDKWIHLFRDGKYSINDANILN